MDKPTLQQLDKAFSEYVNSGGRAKDFIEAVVKQGWYTMEELGNPIFDNEGNLTSNDYNKGGEEQPSNETQGNEEGTQSNATVSNTNKENIPDWNAIAKADAKAAGEKYNEGEGNGYDFNEFIKELNQISGSQGGKIISGWLKNIGSKLKAADSKLAQKALDMIIDSKGFNVGDASFFKGLGDFTEGQIGEILDAKAAGKGIGELSPELQKLAYKKILGTVLQGLFTDVMMVADNIKDNNSGLNKNNWRSGIFNAIDSATETLPIINLVDLGLDGAGIAIKDDNGERYYKGGVLSKLSNLVEQGIYSATDGKYGDNTVRTFWQNDPEQQQKDKEAVDWMKERGYEWGTGLLGIGNNTKKNSKARVEKENKKAIDKIQNSKKGEGLKSAEAVDKQQQDKRDANLYISYHNIANGKNIDDKGAYTYSDFVKDFKQDNNGTRVNKKTNQTANEMRKIEQNKSKAKEKPEGDTINI